jgi:hypothetical protein
MNRFALIAAVSRMLRQAQVSGLKSLLDSAAMRYKRATTPELKARYMRMLTDSPDLWEAASSTIARYVRNIYPTTKPEDIEDIASQSIAALVNRGGLEHILESWNPDNAGGARSFSNWFSFALRQEGTHAATLLAQEKARAPMTHSLDAPISGNPKFQSPETEGMPMPEHMAYQGLTPDTDYSRLLPLVEQQIAQFRGKHLQTADRERLNQLLDTRKEVMQHMQAQKEFAATGTNARIPQRAAPTPGIKQRPMDQIPKNYLKNTIYKSRIVDMAENQATAQQSAKAYNGIGQFVTDPNNGAYLPAMYKGPLGKYMAQAMVDTKIILDHGRSKNQFDVTTNSVAQSKTNQMKAIFTDALKKRMAAAKVAPDAQNAAVEFVQESNPRAFLNRIGDADEWMRLYNAEQARIQHAPKHAWGQIPEDLLPQIANTAYENTGYEGGAKMYARQDKTMKGKPGIDQDLSPLKPTFNASLMREHMLQEARNWNQGLTGNRRSPLVLKSSGHYQSHTQAPMEAPMAQQSPQTFEQPQAVPQTYQQGAQALTAQVESVQRVALALERVGMFREADVIDTQLRLAHAALSVRRG